MKILAIDDNAAVLEVIALMLTSDGHTVATAGGGRAGPGWGSGTTTR